MKHAAGYIAGAACVALALVILYLAWYTPVTTVILVRHAERLNDTDTSSISAEGLQRAAELAHVVGQTGVVRIFVTDIVRTQQTAAPAAALFDRTPVQIPADQTDRLVDSLLAYRGGVSLVVGHSNTIPTIIKKLGVTPPPIIARNVYDDLFIVTIHRFRTSCVQLKYGKPG